MVACTTARLWVEDDNLGFTGVSRTRSVLGGSRMRSVLGGSSLGGSGLAWVAAPMGAISPVLGATRLCF